MTVRKSDKIQLQEQIVIMAVHYEPPCPGVNHYWHAKRERGPS